MNERFFDDLRWDSDRAVDALAAEIRAAAARLERRRRQRREALLFGAALALAALLLGLVCWTVPAGGTRGLAAIRRFLKAVCCLAGMTLLLSPLLAYFIEGRKGDHA